MMRKCVCPFVLLVVSIVPCLAVGEDQPKELSEHLQPFAPYLGKTWKGEFVGSTDEKPLFDVTRMERALNGKAIRILHSMNDGEYGGESIVMWDAKEKCLATWYFTTAGFFTKGTMKFEGDMWVAQESVTGNANGITAVKSTSQVLPDGRLHTKSEYLKDDKWIKGHEVYYREDPQAKVIFK
jgi:hypothetical protein